LEDQMVAFSQFVIEVLVHFGLSTALVCPNSGPLTTPASN
jgi:hypothetical protein